MTERLRTAESDDTDAWSQKAAAVKARLQSDRQTRFFRIVSAVHVFSAFTLITANIGVLLHTGTIQWPWWYSCLLAAATILPIVSGASAWFWKAPPISLFFVASISVVLPLLYAGYYRSPILWANLIVICILILYVFRRRKAAETI